MTRASQPKLLLAVVLCCFAVLPPARAGASDLAVSVGVFDVGGNDALKLSEAGLELRWRDRGSWELQPMAGFAANEEGGVWAYGGLRKVFSKGSGWELAPSFGIALYEEGDGKDLGNTLEFRTGIEAAYRTARGYALGLQFYHLSNAGISDHNPGANSLVALVSFPLSR